MNAWLEIIGYMCLAAAVSGAIILLRRVTKR